MSKNRVLAFTVLLAVTIPIFLYGVRFTHKNEKETESFIRNYKGIKLKLEFSKEAHFLVTEMRIYKGRFFLDDFHNRVIVEIDERGNILREFGKKGKGPGEFMRIEGWDIDSSGIYVFDSENSRITEMDFEGSVRSTTKLNKLFLVGNRLNNDKYLFFRADWSAHNESIFYVFDTKDSSYSKLEIEFLKNHSGLALAGFLIKNNQGVFALAGYNFGYILGIDGKGNFLYQTNTIDQTPPAKVIMAGSLKMLDPEAPDTLYSGFADSQRLYLISAIKAENEREKNNLPIDVYDVLNGGYLYSFYIPLYKDEPPVVIAVDAKNNRMIAYQGQTLTFYKLMNRL